ncbi:hypothetical protein [Pedobacter cryophilus]|uniref:Uncharacterized protein n=1 Tax=Pedobacter cryophilus TaxID=2571271 RepID=A0A4U1BWY1_9SPHI|nr:hypothetical protein [Pedobacter cryophilus]TKB96854.1 hypothetical protein FA046_12310 [Pedobacter cryophilus]
MNNRQLKSVKELEAEARHLSNYDGGMVRFEEDQDDLMHFSGSATSFSQALRNLRPYIVTITNNAIAARTALLCPGLIANKPGLIADGAFNDVNGDAGLTASSGSTGTIALFNAYIQKKPTLISGFKLTSSNLPQLDQSMIIKSESPFEGKGEKVISTGTYASEMNNNEKILTITEEFYMDDETRIAYPILPGATVSFIFFIGASVNQAKGLRKKAAKAKASLGM